MTADQITAIAVMITAIAGLIAAVGVVLANMRVKTVQSLVNGTSQTLREKAEADQRYQESLRKALQQAGIPIPADQSLIVEKDEE